MPHGASSTLWMIAMNAPVHVLMIHYTVLLTVSGPGTNTHMEKRKVSPAWESLLWNCQTVMGCKNVDEMPLLWLYPPAQNALIHGCLCSNISYLQPSILNCSKTSYIYCPTIITMPG